MQAELAEYEPEYIPFHRIDEAQAYAAFMGLIERALERGGRKSDTWELITREYNAGNIAPELRKLKGKRAERTIKEWHKNWKDTGDMFAVVHGSSAVKKGRKVTEFEQSFLLTHLLHPNKISIDSAITHLKDFCRVEGHQSPTSKSTLRRWINDWRAENGKYWDQARCGSTYVKNYYLKSIQRDDSMLKVGDVLVADGHVIANDIKSPDDGKLRRMTLIMFYDWKSRYPVGASLALTENSVHILTALRASILQLGFTPRFIYFDNGKAFKSKIFHKKAEEHDLSKELAGYLPRLGISSHFAREYNARSKVIERFFKTLQDQWERFQAGFRGSNIGDKPAPLLRNEKWAQKLFNSEPMEYQEALGMIDHWVRNYYGGRVHSSLRGKTPWQVFSEREIPADRVINQRDLDILLLADERVNVRKEGIWLNKMRYYHKALVDWIGQPVTIRYDYADVRSILVYDTKSRFICQAELRESRHPLAALAAAEGNPVPMQEVIKEDKENRRTAKRIEQDTKKIVLRNKAALDALLAKMNAEKGETEPAEKQENKLFPEREPVIKPPAPEYDVNDEVGRLERLIAQMEADNEKAAEKGADTEEDLPAAVGFGEMLKITGLNHGGNKR